MKYYKTLHDLRDAGVGIVTLGQYLRPTLEHYPVAAYITPEKFEWYRLKALEMGFSYCASAPLSPLVVHGGRGPEERQKFVAMEASCRGSRPMDYKTCWELQQGLFDALGSSQGSLQGRNETGGGTLAANAGTAEASKASARSRHSDRQRQCPARRERNPAKGWNP